MATLTNTKIKDTYDGLLKTTDNEALDASGVTLIEDGLGNASALSVGRSGNGVSISGNLAVDTDTLYVNTSVSRVGINTNSPSQRLHIKEDDATAVYARVSNSAGVFEAGVDASGNGEIGMVTADALLFNTSGSEKMRIDSSGNLGIGEQNPSRPLHISADTPAIRLEDTTGSDYSELVSVNGDLFIRADEGNTEANSTIRFQIDQSEKMRIDSSGNVGIGESSPAEAIHLGGSSNQQIRINAATVPAFLGGYNNQSVFTSNRSITTGSIINSSYGSAYISLFSNTSGGDVRLFTSSAANVQPVERMRVDSSGRVGIGTSTITANANADDLQIGDGTGGSRGLTITAQNNSGAAIYFGDADDTDIGSIRYDNSDNSMKFFTNTSESMRIDSSGNVGIGTSNPASYYADNLVVSSGSNGGITIASDNTINYNWLAFADGTTGNAAYRGMVGYYHTNDSMLFYTSATERMRIDSSGRVGINTQTSDGLLTISRTGFTKAVASGISLKDQNGTTRGGLGTDGTVDNYLQILGLSGIKFHANNVDGSTEHMRITSGGDVLIGSGGAEPSASQIGLKIGYASSGTFVNNAKNVTTTTAHINFFNPNGLVGAIKTSASSTIYETSSDYRLKENVVEMTGALDRVDALKPSRFNFIADPETTVDGFLAHEVAEVIPEAITGEKDAVDEEGNPIYQGIDQSKIVPLLVGAIKELRAEIELLKSQING